MEVSMGTMYNKYRMFEIVNNCIMHNGCNIQCTCSGLEIVQFLIHVSFILWDLLEGSDCISLFSSLLISLFQLPSRVYCTWSDSFLVYKHIWDIFSTSMFVGEGLTCGHVTLCKYNAQDSHVMYAWDTKWNRVCPYTFNFFVLRYFSYKLHIYWNRL